jgi:universal stress protein A
MAFPYRRILCPIDFDENSLAALVVAAQFAKRNDGTVFVLHVVPMIIPPTGMPVYVDMYKSQEETARDKLREVAHKYLSGVKYELTTHVGDPAGAIVKTAKKLSPDVLVMSTHGRRGFSRVFLGSVAEMVLREAPCPVLTVRSGPVDKHRVGRWMTSNPVTTDPEEKLSLVQERMQQGGFRSMPVLSEGKLVGVITDRDLRQHVGYLDHTEVKLAMSEQLVTATPETTIQEAARLMRERKIGAMPVVEDGKLIGIISTSDILQAFIESE